MKLIRQRPAAGSRTSPLFLHADPDVLISETSDAATAATRLAGVLNDLRFGGGWKRTGPGRLGETVRAIARYVAAERATEIDVLDVGASDATTTIELVDALKAGGARRVTACVMDKYLWLYRFTRAGVVEYRDADGAPVLSRIGPVGLRLPRSESRWNWPANVMAAAYMRLARFRAGMRQTHALSLLAGGVASRPDVRVIEQDCLIRRPDLVNAIDVVRISNVLNPVNFSTPQMRVCIDHLHAYLRPRGCLLVSRNVDRETGEIEQGTLWRRTREGFTEDSEFSGGSEVSAVVASYRAG